MKQLLSLVLTAALLLSGCGVDQPSAPAVSSSNEGTASIPGYVALGWLAQAEADYPEFPSLPLYSEQEGYEAYFEAQERYYNAVSQLRGEGISPQTASLLTGFAARSTPLVLEGRQGENTLYSPLSLWSALALLAQSAAGDSRAQVLAALDTDSVEMLQEQVSQVWRGLHTDNGSQSLVPGNSIWLNSAAEASYVQETLDILSSHYYSSVYSVPMGTLTADAAVNDWVSRQTNGLIGPAGPVVETQPDTLALLVSALYYKDGWSSAFPTAATQPDTFTTAAGIPSTVDFMHQTIQGTFFLRENYQAASLSTGLGRMIFLLPEEGTTPEELLQDPQLLPSLISGQSDGIYGKIQWSVPKFDLSGDLDLHSTLASLGIQDLLDPDLADLSSLTSISAYLDQARQLARVRVDEEGVEAAAVTVLTMKPTSAPIEEPPVCVMDLDRPFLFVIMVEDVPLFIGIVNQVS